MVNSSSVRLTRALSSARVWLMLLGVLVLALGSAGSGAVGLRTASAQEAANLPFQAMGGSKVVGFGSLTSEGQGTKVSIRLAGLGSNAPTQATLHVGSCDQPSGDALWTLDLQWVDERGRGDGEGTVAFNDRPVPLREIADGKHVMLIRSAGQTVACAAIAALLDVDELPRELLAEGEQEQAMQFNPGAALQMRIFADGFVPNSPEFRSTFEGTTYAVQRAEHLRTGAVRAYFAAEGDWAHVRFYQRGRPADALGSYLLDAAEQHQAIQFNPRAALQAAIFAAGFVPNSGEFGMSFNGISYTGQRAEHLRDGRVRVYYAVSGQWNKVSHAERR